MSMPFSRKSLVFTKELVVSLLIKYNNKFCAFTTRINFGNNQELRYLVFEKMLEKWKTIGFFHLKTSMIDEHLQQLTSSSIICKEARNSQQLLWILTFDPVN